MKLLRKKTDGAVTAPVGTVKRRKPIKWDLLALFLPGFIAFFVFTIVPYFGITIAFKDYNMTDGIFGSEWVGFEHFERLFSNPEFLRVLRNTIVIAVVKLVVAFPAPIIFALLLNEIKNMRFKKTIQTFSYLPHFFSWVVLAGIFQILFSNGGTVNQMLMEWGIIDKPIPFFTDGNTFIGLLAGSHVWQSFGWGSILYLSAISGIDSDLYEAATIDGAGYWKQATKITLPLLAPTIITLLIMNTGNIIQAGFSHVYNMYNISVYDKADIIDTYVLRRMQSMDYSLSAAAGLFKSVVSLVLVVAANTVAKKISHGEQGLW